MKPFWEKLRLIKVFSYSLFVAISLLPYCAYSAVTININASDIRQPISPLLWGGNIPGWDIREGNVKSTVMNALRDLNLSIVRFPGGLVSDVYHWEDGTGESISRKLNADMRSYFPHRKGYQNNKVGTDEFMDFITSLNSYPLITVNVGTGTPEDAARWVQYCNRDKDTLYGAKRISNGHLKPYSVRFWEVGNELYGEWHKLQMDAKTYAGEFTNFSKAMKREDPSIKIGLIGGLTEKHLHWTEDVVEAAGEYADYIAFHLYYPHEAGNKMSRQEFTNGVLSVPLLVEGQLQRVRKHPLVNKYGLDIAFTEYNTKFPLGKGSHTPRDLTSALSIADLLQVFIRQSVFMANFWSVYDDTEMTLISDENGTLKKSPAYYVLSLYSADFGDNVVGTDIQNSHIIESPNLLRKGSVIKMPAISVVAGISEDKDSLYLIAINKDQTRSVDLLVNIKGFVASPDVQVWTVTGADPYSDNDGSIEKVRSQLKVISGGSTFNLPPFSVTKLKWIKRS